MEDNLYIVICESEFISKSDDERNERETFVLGLFDTSQRAISYMRKYFTKEREKNDYCSFEITEDNKGSVFARLNENKYGIEGTESIILRMSPIAVNDKSDPEDDIISNFVG